MQRAIGRYELLEELEPDRDTGSYRAVDPSTAREVAVQMLGDERCADGQFRYRLLTAARSAANLSHPSIVTIFDVGEIDGRPYMATELLRGPTLAEALQERRPLGLRQIVELGAQVADALDHAHAKGVVHGEVVPGNIVLAGGNRPAKLKNFCVGEVARNNVAPDTAVADNAAPVQFVSPEHVVQKKLDGRSDLFSLGSLLYRTIGGEAPFTADTTANLFLRVLRQDPPPLEDRLPDVPRGLRKIVVRLLQKKPEKRFQTGAETADALREALQTLPENDATVSMAVISTEPPFSSGLLPIAPVPNQPANDVRPIAVPEPPPIPETLMGAPAESSPAEAVSPGGITRGSLAADDTVIEVAETVMRPVSAATETPVDEIVSARRPPRPRGRVIAISALVLATVAAFFFLTRAQDAALNQINTDYGRTLGHTVGTEIAELLLLEDWVAIESLIQAIGETGGMTYLIAADREGIVRGSTEPGTTGRAYERPWKAEPISEDEHGRVFQHVLPGGQRVLDLEVPITFQGKAVGRVFLGVSQAPERALTRITLAVLVAMMLVGAACILFCASRS